MQSPLKGLRGPKSSWLNPPTVAIRVPVILAKRLLNQAVEWDREEIKVYVGTLKQEVRDARRALAEYNAAHNPSKSQQKRKAQAIKKRQKGK